MRHGHAGLGLGVIRQVLCYIFGETCQINRDTLLKSFHSDFYCLPLNLWIGLSGKIIFVKEIEDNTNRQQVVATPV